jgi:hypothetical protein
MLLWLVGGVTPLFAQGFDRRPPGARSPTIHLAGPSWLTATASVPTRLDLRWAAVANAGWYRLTRSSASEPSESPLLEIPATTGDQDLAGKYYYYFDNLPARSGGVTFSYKVYAIFPAADGSRTLSAPSPTTSVTALTPVAPPNLRWRAAVSPLMGRLRLTFDWSPVALATGYQVFQIARPPTSPLPMPGTTVRQAQFIIDNVLPGQGGTVCVVTLYEELLKDDTVRSCVQVTTRAPS